jgi:hypothetical protein
MRVTEVKRGMKGYGLSVFQGTRIDRFDVEVIDVLHNFNPKSDVVLIRCAGANLEHTGPIAGMSGSPIYLYDDQGRARMIGAFAYGWSLMKDPIAGVQPIEYMLELPVEPVPVTPAPRAEAESRRPFWKLTDSVPLPGDRPAPDHYPTAGWGDLSPNPSIGASAIDHAQLRPLATPMMTGGMSPAALKRLSPIFSAYGLAPLQAGGGSSSAPTDEKPPELEPGSALVVPLLTGDVDFSAVGTVTEVIGNRVYGFGHGFNNEGSIALPMGSGRINTVIASIMTSFKIGELSEMKGTLRADRIVGIAGQIGQLPEMLPIELHVVYSDGSIDQTYHFNSALHPQLTPLICGAALISAVTGRQELPTYHTLDYDLSIEFANGQTVSVSNEMVNSGVGMLFFEIGNPIVAASENPFERVMPKKVSGTVRVIPESRDSTILYVNVPRQKYRPGEIVKAYIVHRPFRAAESILPIEFELPADLPEGQYQLSISDWSQYLQDEQTAKPFRFTAEDIDGVFEVLKDVAAVKHNAIYIRLLRQADGIAIGRAAMPHLPSSRREVLLNAGRSNTTPFVSSTVKIVPTTLVMSGSAQFMLTIDKNAKVEVGAGKPKTDAVEPAKETTPIQNPGGE